MLPLAASSWGLRMAWRFCGRCRAARQCVFRSQKKTLHDWKGLKELYKTFHTQAGLCALHIWSKSEQIFRQRLYTSIPTTFSHPKGDQVPETKVCALPCIFVKFAGRQSRLGEQTDNEGCGIFPPHCYSEEEEFLLTVHRKSLWTLSMTNAKKEGLYFLIV